ncbi:hypothetical protein Tco_0622836 [Tanacetum coccineum]
MLPPSRDQLEGGIPFRIPIEVFPGCLQRRPSNTNGQGRQKQKSFLRRRGSILLPEDALRRNLKAYLDDMVIKSISEEDMLKDIQETFDRFRSIDMKLNPKSVLSVSKKVHS